MRVIDGAYAAQNLDTWYRSSVWAVLMQCLFIPRESGKRISNWRALARLDFLTFAKSVELLYETYACFVFAGQLRRRQLAQRMQEYCVNLVIKLGTSILQQLSEPSGRLRDQGPTESSCLAFQFVTEKSEPVVIPGPKSIVHFGKRAEHVRGVVGFDRLKHSFCLSDRFSP